MGEITVVNRYPNANDTHSKNISNNGQNQRAPVTVRSDWSALAEASSCAVIGLSIPVEVWVESAGSAYDK